MSFLEVIPYTLFRMLSSSAHVRNVAILESIFEQFFDDFTFAPRKGEVLQVIRQVLDHPDFRTIADDDEVTPASEIVEYVVYGRLRDDGWIMEVANRKVTEVYMPREAHALLSSLITLREELKVDISAEASLIDSGIIAAYQDPVGKVMNIASARRQAVQLRRSIDGVLTSLHRIEEDLMRSEGLADLLARFMERFVEKRASSKRPDGMPVGRPFQSGKSGNPAGRPVGSVSVKAELQKIVDLTIKGEHNPFTEEFEDMPVGRKIALNLAIITSEGDMWAIKEVRDMIDGKPAQSVNIGGQDDNPVQHTFTLKIANG